jgi:hypothetical protein
VAEIVEPRLFRYARLDEQPFVIAMERYRFKRSPTQIGEDEAGITPE